MQNLKNKIQIQKKLSLLLAAFSLLALLALSQETKADKIAVVDPGRFEEHSIYKNYKERVLGVQNSYKESFKTLREDLEKDLKSEQADDAKKMQLRKEAQQRLEAEKTKVLSLIKVLKEEVEERFEKAIKQVAKESNYDIVISKVFVFSGGEDITDKVLERVK